MWWWSWRSNTNCGQSYNQPQATTENWWWMVILNLFVAGMPDTLWCFAYSYTIYVHNHRYNCTIDELPIIKWKDYNYELHSNHLHIFGSKWNILTKAEYTKQLQTRAENIHVIIWAPQFQMTSYQIMLMDISLAMPIIPQFFSFGTANPRQKNEHIMLMLMNTILEQLKTRSSQSTRFSSKIFRHQFWMRKAFSIPSKSSLRQVHYASPSIA